MCNERINQGLWECSSRRSRIRKSGIGFGHFLTRARVHLFGTPTCMKRAVVQALASDRSSVSGGDAQMLNLVVPGGDCHDGASVKEPSSAVQQQAQDDQIRNNEEFSRDVIITPAAETESIIISKTAEKQAKTASACS